MVPSVQTPDFSRRLWEVFDLEASNMAVLTVARNAHVYNCGDEDLAVYLVERGRVKTVTYSQDGKKCLLSIYGPGDVFGELCLLPGRRTETATAMRASTIRRIPAVRFRCALQDAELMRSFLRHLTVRVDEQRRTITDLVMMDGEHRLAVVLLRLAWKLGRPEPDGIVLDQRITQEELSEMVGTTRSRVGYFLKQFAGSGLVRRTADGRIVVNEHELMRYVNSGA